MAFLIIATRNKHKVGEIRAILGDQHEYATLELFPGSPAVIEDAPTFAGNAVKKSSELAAWLQASGQSIAHPNAFVLADDSGLEVDALGGAPGVYSARFAADETGSPGNSPDAANNRKLLRLLAGVPEKERTARFRCALALTPIRNGQADSVVFEGACEGRIAFEPAGQGGFGYDPLFHPLGQSKSFAELGEDFKNTISHRSVALKKAAAWLEEK